MFQSDRRKAAFEGQYVALQSECNSIVAKRACRRRDLARILQRKAFIKSVNSLQKLAVTGSREQPLPAYQQHLSLDLSTDPRADNERTAKKQASTASAVGEQLASISSFFETSSRNSKGKGKEVEGNEDQMEDDKGIGGPPEEGAGSIHAADEHTDPNVELAGLSSDVEISRIAVTRFYFGRIKSWERLQMLLDLHNASGYCPSCPLDQAGLKKSRPQQSGGVHTMRLTRGGPIQQTIKHARFNVSEEPSRHRNFTTKVFHHLQKCLPC